MVEDLESTYLIYITNCIWMEGEHDWITGIML
jgi:hypothetical protein